MSKYILECILSKYKSSLISKIENSLLGINIGPVSTSSSSVANGSSSNAAAKGSSSKPPSSVLYSKV